MQAASSTDNRYGTKTAAAPPVVAVAISSPENVPGREHHPPLTRTTTSITAIPTAPRKSEINQSITQTQQQNGHTSSVKRQTGGRKIHEHTHNNNVPNKRTRTSSCVCPPSTALPAEYSLHSETWHQSNNSARPHSKRARPSVLDDGRVQTLHDARGHHHELFPAG